MTERTPPTDALPSIDFSTFVVSLHHSALVHLGEARNPETEAIEQNLPLARQTIDVLSMLEDKTRGNLTGEEERLITQVLFELRLRYVELEKRQAG